VKNLQKELKKLEKEEKKRISNRLEADLFQDEKKEHQLKALSQQMGAAPITASSPPTEDETQITAEILQQISQDPAKLTSFLIAMGPKEIKRLEKAVQRLAADPNYHFTKEQVDETVEKLKEFSADAYQASQEIDEEFQRSQLIEQIRLEKEKQAVIQECMHDLQVISRATHNS
jgi:hypothetical protein